MIATFQKNTAAPDRNGQHQSFASTTTKLNAAEDTVLLQKNQYASMRDAAGWTVKALSGAIWITQDGDVRDIVLEAGQSFVLDRNGSALLSPLNTSKIRVTRESVKSTTPCGAAKPANRSAFSGAHASFA